MNKYIDYLEKRALDLKPMKTLSKGSSKMKMPSISPSSTPTSIDSKLSKQHRIPKSNYEGTGAATKLELKTPKIKPKV